MNYELSSPQYRVLMLIKHKGIPIYCGERLITPHSIVFWWPPNWVWLLLLMPSGILKILKNKTTDKGGRE